MTRRELLVSATAAAVPHSRAAQSRKPNVVFILADDLGWRDTTPYGSKFYETPNIAKLAARGMLFRQAYAAAPICSPTRASVLTGLYPARIGITTPVCHLPEVLLDPSLTPKAKPDQRALQAVSITRLKQEYYTLAEALRDAGYATGHFGKWHLGHEPYDALHQGFGVDVPHYPGPGPAGGYLGPWKFPNFTGEPGEHIEDRMAMEAEKFIRANKDRPFYLNYWSFSIHAPHGGKPELIEKYKAKPDANYAQRNAVNGAMVQSLDEAVGRLLNTIDELGLAGNTIFVFTSDNGGITFQNIGTDVVTSNAPLRGGKAMLYEGGTREPSIVVWPGTATPGSICDEIISSIDYYPTLLEMTSLAPRQAVKFDGVSFVPALKGGKLSREATFCHFPHYTPATGGRPGTYVRKGDWKLIRFYCDNEDQTDRCELYNIKDDISETWNLASKMPAKVTELNILIDRFLKDTGAMVPKPNPDYRR
jgi:arylsulfatase A-like enzyme